MGDDVINLVGIFSTQVFRLSGVWQEQWRLYVIEWRLQAQLGYPDRGRPVTGNPEVCRQPHRRWEPLQYKGWKYPTPYQQAGYENQIFAKDTWGGTFHDDFQLQPDDTLVTEHWGSSGFSNTDLDYLLTKAAWLREDYRYRLGG
jgi:hypothetical protein